VGVLDAPAGCIASIAADPRCREVISGSSMRGNAHRENYIAERIAIDHYRKLIRYFADDDPATRTMLEGILTTEEEHANDMHDLLVAHQGRPALA
jgi:bacterioferritin (cytochrome b1)